MSTMCLSFTTSTMDVTTLSCFARLIIDIHKTRQDPQMKDPTRGQSIIGIIFLHYDSILRAHLSQQS